MDMKQEACGHAPTELDTSRVEAGVWSERPFPGDGDERQRYFQVVCKRSVLKDIACHGHSSREIEVCGVLVGNVYRDEVGPYLFVEASIRGEFATNHAAQVTFTSATWSHIHDALEQHHSGQRIVGWYHTHPGFGIFLSGMDLFIHEHFFNLPWQVAYVYDPLRDEEGMFLWRQGKPVREPFVVEENAMNEPVIHEALTPQGTGAKEQTRPTDLLSRMGSLEQRQRLMIVAASVFGLVVILWLAILTNLHQHQSRPDPEDVPSLTPQPGAVEKTVPAGIAE
jgi:proteasome lid subunit RPN8/RPN11